MITKEQQDFDLEQIKVRIIPLGSLAIKHPTIPLALAAGIGYLAATGYYAGKAAALGTPFSFTVGAAQYTEPLIHFMFFIVASAIGIGAGGLIGNGSASLATKHLEDKPRWIRILAFTLTAAFLVGAPIAMWLWVPDSFAMVLPAVVVGVICGLAAASIIYSRGNPIAVAASLGLSILIIYFVMGAFGQFFENRRTIWRVATVNDVHFLIAGYTDNSLLVTPLISTEPHTYVKEFHYLSNDTPGLRLRRAKFEKMNRLDPQPIEIPAVSAP